MMMVAMMQMLVIYFFPLVFPNESTLRFYHSKASKCKPFGKNLS